MFTLGRKSFVVSIVVDIILFNFELISHLASQAFSRLCRSTALSVMATISLAFSNFITVVDKIRLPEFYDMMNVAQIVEVSQEITVTTP